MNKLFSQALIYALWLTLCGSASADQLGQVANWAIVTPPSNRISQNPRICFFFVVTERGNSPILTKGYRAAKIIYPGERIVCQYGNAFELNLIEREIYADSSMVSPFEKIEKKRVRWLTEELTTTGSIELLEESRAKNIKDAEERARAAYLMDYKNATTLEAIERFENKYGSNDPDDLISKLAAQKQELKIQKYRNEFQEAKTLEKINSFIAKYKSFDPDNLIPQLQVKLPTIKKQEAAQREVDEKAARNERTNQEIASIESQIMSCNRQISHSKATMERERRIAAVSGYENKIVMRQAGELLVACEDQLRTLADRYKAIGGKKRAADFQ